MLFGYLVQFDFEFDHDVQEKKTLKKEKKDITNAQFNIPVTKNKTIKSGDMVKLDVKFCLNKRLIL